MPTTSACPVCGCRRATRAPACAGSFSTVEIARAIARASPARTACASAASSPAAALMNDPAQREQLAGDHEALHLARPLPDRAQLGVTQVALDGIVLEIAVAAVNLHGVER